jgi:diguanylate cyclase (GGDEF)-like protein
MEELARLCREGSLPASSADDRAAPARADDMLARAQQLFLEESLVEAASWARRALASSVGTADDGAPVRAAAACDAATLLARIARRADDPGQALRWVDVALRAAHAVGDHVRECRAHVQHARVLNDLGETMEALSAADAAQRAALVSQEPESEAAALEAVADTQWSMAQWDGALQSYARMLELARGLGNLELQAIAHGGLGGVNHFLGDSAGSDGDDQLAAHHFRIAAAEAQAYARCAVAAGDRHGQRTATHNHAVALLGMGDTAAARAALREAMAAGHERRGSDYALALKNLGSVDVAEGLLDDARAHFVEALELSEQQGQAHHGMACCDSLVEVCEAAGDLAAALAYHRRFHALYVQVASKAAHVRAGAMAVKFDTDRAKAAAETQRARAEALHARHESLSEEAERLVLLSLEDPLTGVGNRRRLDATLSSVFDQPEGRRHYSMALLDIDHFKQVNDSFSHQVGDMVLQRIGAILRAQSRRHDVVARFGGEEFAVVLQGLDAKESASTCERIRRAIENEPWSDLAPSLRVTASIGLAHAAECQDASSLVALADSRLYAAKRGGRNRVCAEHEGDGVSQE